MVGICRLLMQSGSLVCLIWFLKKKDQARNFGIIYSIAILSSGVGVCGYHVWMSNPTQRSSTFVKLPKSVSSSLCSTTFPCVWSIMLSLTSAKCQWPHSTNEMSFALVSVGCGNISQAAASCSETIGSAALVKAYTSLSYGIKCQARLYITCP